MNKHIPTIAVFIGLAGFLAVASPSGRETSVPDGVKAIFTAKCAVCHKGKFPPQGLNLEAESIPASLLDVASREMPGLKLLDTSDPEASYLLKKVMGSEGIAGKRMPSGRPPLIPDEIALLADWAKSFKADSGASPILASPIGGMSSQAGVPGNSPAPRPHIRPPFWGTRLVNLPTTATVDKGDLLFRVSHRFVPAVSSGPNGFWGLDGPAMVFMSFGYGITDNLSLSFGRARLFQELDLGLSWLALEQGKSAALPFSAALHVGGSWALEKQVGRDRSDSRNFKFNVQVSLSRQFSDRVSLLIVPSYSTNTNHWAADPESTLGLGLGGRFVLFGEVSAIGEWIPVLSGYKGAGYENGWGIGLEKKIGLHVFQFFVTNSYGLTPSQVLTGGDLRLADGDFRVGFNIFRTF